MNWAKTFTSLSSLNALVVTALTGPIKNAATNGLVLQGAGDPSVIAFDVGTGTTWTWMSGGAIDDIVVGESGTAYLLVSTESRVYAIDTASGKTRFVYTNVPSGSGPGAELLLRGGRVYVIVNGVISSFPVPSIGYDPTSPWPTRFQDNQRTNNAQSPMTW